MHKVKQKLSWLNSNLLFILSVFLVAFIPLFPKIPLFDALPGYIVRVRVEDFLVLFTALVWLRDAFKKRFEWNTSYFWLVLIYAFVGLSSILSGIFLQQSIPEELLHIGKSGLHFFRYMEYFALFFFLYSSVKTTKHLKIIFTVLIITLVGIVAYGFGQQYLHFPLYSTMNREYSKGETLYLQENARPQSTFAGHYDLGAYLVIVLPLIFALSIGSLGKSEENGKKKPIKKQLLALRLILHTIHALGAWMLVTSGSKTALVAYFTGILIVLILNLAKFGKNFKQQLKWGVVSLFALMVVIGAIFVFFGKETQQTLVSIAQRSPTAHKIISRIPGITITETNADLSRPEDLYGEGHESLVEVTEIKDGIEITKLVEKHSTWSENALKYGISMGIRLDTLWPQAISGLINNPLLGNAYGTLSRTQDGQFVEADSTDNNFLRTMGETGLLGFMVFYGLIIFILTATFKNTKHHDPLVKIFNIGFVGSIIGILINASYIDVFAASKVAFTFWALSGIAEKSKMIDQKESKMHRRNVLTSSILSHLNKHKSIYVAILLLFFLMHKNPYIKNSLVKNFDTSQQAIENVVATKCYLNFGSFSVCRNNGTTLKDNLNLYSVLLVPFAKLNNKPTTFYFLNFALLLLTLLITYKILNKYFFKNNSLRNDISKLVLLLIPILIFYLLKATSQPLVTSNIVILFIASPMLSFLYAKIITRTDRYSRNFFKSLVVIAFFFTLYKSNALENILISFRNNTPAYSNWAVRRTDEHLNTKYSAESDKSTYLISGINPFYFDLYKSDKYQLLPMSESQSYFENAQQVWSDLVVQNNQVNLTDTYQKVLDDQNQLFITDYGTQTSIAQLISFNQIKRDFDLTYEVIDCDELCNIYHVVPQTEKVSDLPTSINQNLFDLNKLNEAYSFSVVSNRYSPRRSTDPLHNTTTFIQNLNQSQIAQDQSFLIFTGDIIHYSEDSWSAYFANNYANLIEAPILYNPGNFDLIPQKQYPAKYYRFFGENDYFLFLNLGEESTIDDQQKLFAYNALLELEELPNIKNLFIIAHNLNWQDQSNPDNFIHNLENKLADFSSLNKFIISANHDINENNESQSHFAHQINEETKTQYFASLEDGQTNFSFLKFNLDSQSNVNFENIELDLPKTYSEALQNSELE